MRKALLLVLTIQFAFNVSFSQNSSVKISVKWPSISYENKVEVYNTANDLLVTLCDDTQCYSSTQLGTTDRYGGTFDLGCVANGNNYYIKIFDIADDGWSGSYVSVKVAGVEVIYDTGTTANSTGQTIFFNVSGGDATCNTILDTDSDGLADYLDYDDDADGIADAIENLGEDRFECTLPALDFENGVYDAAASSGAVDTVGAVYRFSNALVGYDVLMEILELDNTSISNIDNDTVDNPTYLQTELTFTGAGTPGAKFKFTIVNVGTTTPSTEIFRVNGTTWDCDGSGGSKESVVYYDPAAYGTENPTSLLVTDLGAGDIEISASGLMEGPGFSTLLPLRAYYQFIGNSFTMRMQAIRTDTNSTTRQFGMSFTQCEFLDFNANSLIIITGEDNDGDGDYNHLDLDSDNDGIPDNVEGQPTVGYVIPTGTVGATGIDTAYGTGIAVVDTDGDNTPDILDLDTDSDGLPDIEENGMANAIITFTDTDSDGLDDLFEGGNTNDPLDVNDEIDTPATSILPDTDGDLAWGGDLDYRDGLDVYVLNASLDFDGVDDYLSGDTMLNGLGEITIMAWIKIAPENAGVSYNTIAGEDISCRLFVEDGNKLRFGTRTTALITTEVDGGVINYDEWHHIAGTFSGTDGKQAIYVDGKEVTFNTNASQIGQTIAATGNWNGEFEVGRLSTNLPGLEYFDGEIDELRVFDKVLTNDQIQRIVYQEIKNVSGNVRGVKIDKDIVDIQTSEKVSWSNVLAYYPMTNIVDSRTDDYSSNTRTLVLNNITTLQAQTAPMPYETVSDGDWTDESTWLHGKVWDIEDVATNKDWGIVHIKDDLTTSNSHIQLGMFVDSDKTITVNGDNEINNTWYLELNGVMDLRNDSQLIQGGYSDLVTSSSGKLLRRQEGTSNVYWYNYWSSPVGAVGATTLIDNNTAANNANNTDFTLNTIMYGDNTAAQFTSAYNEIGKISTTWLYTFEDGVTYYDWSIFSPSGAIKPGVGYTQKGTGVGAQQDYIFEGKPNNGTIVISATDTGGPGSVGGTTKTECLLGNPYPSAIDIHKFIDDNIAVIGGELQLWEQWSGASHVTTEYNGGYATVNKLSSVRAYQFEGGTGDVTTDQDGTLNATRYLPIGQGFFVEIKNSGNIVFNNSQRVFVKEGDANGTYNAGSVFFKSNVNNSNNAEVDDVNAVIGTFRLNLETTEGATRELVLGFSDSTSDGYDYGYDAKNTDLKADDLNLLMNDQEMLMQAYGAITPDKVVPLQFKATGNFNYSIEASKFTDIDENQDIYLRDNYNYVYHDLREGAYQFTSSPGLFQDRFEIVFQPESSLGTEDFDDENTLIYFNNQQDLLFVKGLNEKVLNITLCNALGQSIAVFNDVSNATLQNGLSITNLSSGMYVVGLKTENNINMNKKIIIK